MPRVPRTKLCRWRDYSGPTNASSVPPWRKGLIGCTTCRSAKAVSLRSRSGQMKFDELDALMRVYETAHDLCVLPGIYIVARLDGRSFTRLTKDVHQFQAPFDPKFRDLMLDTAEHLMTEFNAVYGYTQSDEISLLFPLACDLFNRKLRKLNSVLAG